MTIVLALGNVDQVVQISDRQLTDERGEPCVVSETKTTVVTLADARLLCGFAGLARAGSFRAAQWIVDALFEAAAEDHHAYGTVERFTDAATARFRRPDLRAVARKHRGLSILLTGYRDVLDPPRIIAALVTNYQNVETGRDEEPWDEFRAKYWTVKPEGTYIQRIGQWPAMEQADELAARRALEERKPARAIIDLGAALVRRMAARPAARGTIGKDLSSAVLGSRRPPELAQGRVALHGDFHPMTASHAWHGVHQVVSLSDDFQLAMLDPQIEPVEKTPETALSVPKVGRNKLCPCGSGKKYKLCHGA